MPDKTDATSVPVQPGQTVWHRHTHEMFDIIAIKGPNCWCWSVSRCKYETISVDDLTATNPESLPQKCPFCGGEAFPYEATGGHWLSCEDCLATGPKKPTHLEAIQTWNQIMLNNQPTGRCEQGPWQNVTEAPKPADSEPLTEEWLRKVGIWQGITSQRDGRDTPPRMEPVVVQIRHRITGRLAVIFEYEDGNFQLVATDNLKTRDDVRQLCRLLGVTLKE